MSKVLREHSAILMTYIKLPFIFKTFVLSIFEWLLKTGFTVVDSLFDSKYVNYILNRGSNMNAH